MKNNLVFTIILLFISFSGFSQQGGWIETDVSESMTDNSLANCGDNLIIYTTTNSDIVYFYDTNSNAWQMVIFGSIQNFKMVIADDVTAFAYSFIGSQWDAIKYQGTVSCGS